MEGGVGGPATQVPVPSQVSAPLHAFPSPHEVPVVAEAWCTPVPASQKSTVQGFPSSTAGGVPGKQLPMASHSSLPLHTVASGQAVPGGAEARNHPVPGVQVTTWQALGNSIDGGMAGPATQVPAPSQVSAPLQALPSSQLRAAASTPLLQSRI